MDERIGIRKRQALARMTPYSPGKPIWEVQRELGLTDVIKLASNENPLGPSPLALEAVRQALEDLHRYPDAQATDLRRAIAERYAVDFGQTITANGADELITLVAEAFLDPGDEVVVPAPTFSEYRFAAQLMGAETVEAPLANGYAYDPQAIMRALTPRTKIVCLCTPNNPTGTYLSRTALRQILDGLPSHIVVVLDTAYAEYADADDYADGLEFVRAGYPLLALRTFSKIYGLAGIRVGYGIGSADIISGILQVKEPFNVNAPAQVAATAALADERHVRLSRESVVRERRKLYAAFEELGIAYTASMGNFVLATFGPQAQQSCARLLAKGIIVRHGEQWGLPEQVRISVGSPEENDRLIAALRELAADIV